MSISPSLPPILTPCNEDEFSFYSLLSTLAREKDPFVEHFRCSCRVWLLILQVNTLHRDAVHTRIFNERALGLWKCQVLNTSLLPNEAEFLRTNRRNWREALDPAVPTFQESRRQRWNAPKEQKHGANDRLEWSRLTPAHAPKSREFRSTEKK